MRLGGYKTLSRLSVEAIIMGILLLAILLMAACAHPRVGRNEPEWEPHLYIRSVGATCKFIDAYGDHILCDDITRLDLYGLVPLANLEYLKEKFQRCEKWK